MNPVEFRRVTIHGEIKCTCGRVLGSYIHWATQYRTKLASGKWGKWVEIDEARIPTARIERARAA